MGKLSCPDAGAKSTPDIAVPLSVGLGILAAINEGKWPDKVSNIVSLAFISVPEFFIAYILILIFAVQLGWFPSLATVYQSMGFGQRLYVAALPAVTLTMLVAAHMLRMTRAAVLAVMAVFAIALLAVVPSVQLEAQRQRELESIRRGEEVAEAIRQYVEFYRGSKLPESMDDLLDGLPDGTKKRQILRASAAEDPLSEDGKWRLIKPDPETVARFAKRVQDYNNGVLPGNPSRLLDRYTVIIVNSVNTETELEADDDDFEVVTENQPFIGVASQSRMKSIISYYGIDKQSSWIFTPLFRGRSAFGAGPAPAPPAPPRPVRIPQ